MDFSKYNNDIANLRKEVEEAAANGTGDFVKTPYGKYEVKLDSMEIKENKAGDSLMIQAVFKIIAGKEKNKKIWVFKSLKNGKCIHFAKEFLEELGTGFEITFEDFDQFNNLVLDVLEEAATLEYGCDYKAGKNGYDEFKIIDVFE